MDLVDGYGRIQRISCINLDDLTLQTHKRKGKLLFKKIKEKKILPTSIVDDRVGHFVCSSKMSILKDSICPS